MIIALVFSLLTVSVSNDASEWSDEIVVRQGGEAVVRFQARLAGDYLVVRANHASGWHTYAMDNELLAAAALKGKMSLGIEQGIDIQVESGLELDEQWLQSEPLDFSKPELRWFTFGFEHTALFACRVKKVTSDQMALRIRGQACSGETCCQVDVTLKLQASNRRLGAETTPDSNQNKAILKGLVPVTTRNDQATTQDPKSDRDPQEKHPLP